MSAPHAYDDGCDDYEYDQAHDGVEVPTARRPDEPRVTVTVDVPGDDLGDYGYDLAHDAW